MKFPKRFEADRIAEGLDPWPAYAEDARYYIERFSRLFPEIAHTPERLARIRAEGGHPLVVDLCGTAEATSIGAEHTIGFTLTQPENRENTATRTIVVGDIFTSGGVERVAESIRAHGGSFHCLFFRPVGGLGGFETHLRAHVRLYAALQRLYPLLAEDGEMYIELPGYRGAKLLADILNAQSAEPFCTAIIEEREHGGPRTTARIHKTEGAPKALKSLDELNAIPGLTERLVETMDKE